MDVSQVDVSALMSRPIRVLVELIGLPETLKLLEARGGTSLKIPSSAKRATALKAILTDESVQRLCEKWGNQELLVPKNDKITQQLRNHAIRQLRTEKSASKLAVEFDLSRRMIIIICKSATNDQQVDLFD
jgi:Mor family transcriptional regulator